MPGIGEERKVSGVFGGVEAQNIGQEAVATNDKALVKTGFWSKFKSFWLQEKVEDEINEFLHQEITWDKVHDFLFQDVTFGRKKEQL